MTVIVEARERSGALITADLALEEGREVLVVPGDFVEFVLQRPNSGFTVDVLQVAARLVVHAGLIDHADTHRLEDSP